MTAKHIKAKKLYMANGDEFEQVEFFAEQDIMDKFIMIKSGNKTFKVNPDFILSFEETQNLKAI